MLLINLFFLAYLSPNLVTINLGAANEARYYPEAIEKVKSIYNDLGYEVEIDFFPALRSLRESGKSLDGELLRIFDARHLPGLSPVPVPIFKLQTSYVFKRDEKGVCNESFNKIGVVRGLIFSNFLMKENPHYVVADAKQAMEMLNKDRVSGVLLPTRVAKFHAKGMREVRFCYITQGTHQMYHFLNLRNNSVDISSILNQIKLKDTKTEYLEATVVEYLYRNKRVAFTSKILDFVKEYNEIANKISYEKVQTAKLISY